MAQTKQKKASPSKKTNKNKVIVFDMDGVLVDVSKSYILAIKKTAEFFLGRMLDINEIYDLKASMGFNNDYDCAEAIIKRNGFGVRKDALIKKFQEYYKGRRYDGLILNETMLIQQKVLDDLSKKYTLAIFTGRPKDEAVFALEKNKVKDYFSHIVTMEDVKELKPNPEGLNILIKKLKPKEIVYVGDSIDDAQAAISANVSFVGILTSTDKNRQKTLFNQYGIKSMTDNINKIKDFI